MNEILPITTVDRLVLVSVDVQNDFCPGGSLAVNGGDAVVDPLNRTANYVHTHNGDIIFTRDMHPEETPHFNDWTGKGKAGTWPRHCVAGTHGAEFHPRLNVALTDTIINKGVGHEDGYSGYDGKASDGTTIEQIIQPRTPDERVAIALGGLATGWCDLATILPIAAQARRVAEARQGVMEVFAMTDCMRPVGIDPNEEQDAYAQMKAAGITLITSEDILRNRIKVEI